MNVLLETLKSHVVELEGRIEIQRLGWYYILLGTGTACGSLPVMGLYFLEPGIIHDLAGILWLLLPLLGGLLFFVSLLLILKGLLMSLERKYIFDGLDRVLRWGSRKIPFVEISSIRFQRFSSSDFNYNLAELTDFENIIPTAISPLDSYSISALISGRKVYLVEATGAKHYDALRKTAYALHKLLTTPIPGTVEVNLMDSKQDGADARALENKLFAILTIPIGLLICAAGFIYKAGIFLSSDPKIEFMLWVLGPWLTFIGILHICGIKMSSWKTIPIWIKILFVIYCFSLLLAFEYLL